MTHSVPSPVDLEPVQRLTTDLKKASVELGRHEARFLVDTYYAMQDQRIRSAHQMRTLLEQSEPHAVIAFFNRQAEVLEAQVKRALDAYTMAHAVGRWSRGIVGVGPVTAAGLLAHIDIEKAKSAGSIWRYAGLDPTTKWGKGEKRPWNASLKQIAWHLGESFARFASHESDVYGKLYRERKVLEVDRNDAGLNAEEAARTLEKKPTHAQAAIYKAGKLPPGRLDLRAKRYAVKRFLSHWHHVAFMTRFGKEPPRPWVVEHGGHAHVEPPPNWPPPEAASN